MRIIAVIVLLMIPIASLAAEILSIPLGTQVLKSGELQTNLQLPASSQFNSPWGLISDTAYTLRKGEFKISVLGWITYGALDKVQIGTNYLADVFQITNFYWKYNFLDEGDYYPALAVGAIHYTGPVPINNSGSGTDWSINFSKRINPNFSLYGGGSRFSTTSLLVNLIRGASTQRFIGRVGLIFSESSEWRTFIESGFAVSTGSYNDISFGAEWNNKNLPFNLKLGLYFPFVPIVDVYWRF
jgi:hypothetical protein